MGYYAGLDVSLKKTAVCVVDATGAVVREAMVASEPAALVSFFQETGFAMDRIGLEACSLTAWLHDALSGAGLPAVCMETRQAKAAMGAMPIKTTAMTPAPWRRSCAPAGSGRCTSRGPRVVPGAPCWQRAGRC